MNDVVFEGLAELRAALLALPEALRDDAAGIVQRSAAAAAADIVASYPKRTGNLRAGVHVTHGTGGAYSAVAVVVNRAKHAALFENGTQARHNNLGANRGSMPPGRVFVPRVIRHRKAMYAQLAAMLARHGLAVSGSA